MLRVKADDAQPHDETRTTTVERTGDSGTGDLAPAELRAALHAAADVVADYLEDVEDYAVLPDIRPADLRRQLTRPFPEEPESLDVILEDVREHVIPNVTHWQHPSYFAYFSSSASGPGLVGEMLMSGLNANAFLWRTNPAAAELEAITIGWLRDGLGLPETFDGVYNDTASMSSLSALAAAREAATGDAAERGLAERPRLRFYTSAEAHSSIDRAAMILGLGREGSRHVATDTSRAMDPTALSAAIAEDRAAGIVPAAVTATIGTTGTTAIDPVAAIADVCGAEGVWLHVDAAYAGVVALLAERRGPFAGWERADSITINPHKWLFTPVDVSLLLTRRLEVLRAALSLVPEYLRTVGDEADGRNYSEYVPQLGRRGRSIKMWVLLRAFGLAGLRRRIAAHLDLTSELAGWIDAEPATERLAEAPFGLVCFRWLPGPLRDRPSDEGSETAIDAFNEALLTRLNTDGRMFLSHTRIDGRFALRIAIGNIRTERRHVEAAWAEIRATARQLEASGA